MCKIKIEMKKHLSIIACFFLFGALLSCSEVESVEPQFDYIRFETGSSTFLFNVEYDDFWNTYFWNPDLNRDQVGIIMTDKNRSFRASMFISGSRLFEKEFPLVLNSDAIIEESGIAGVSVVNDLIPVDTVFGTTDSVNYLGNTMQSFSLTIDAFENEVISGSFSGELATRTGKVIPIRNGRFKVKIKIR